MRLFFASLLMGLVADAHAFELRGDAFDRVRGTYVLADGHVAQLSGTRRRPRIEFDDAPTRALRAVSDTEFVGADGCTRVVFEAQANGEVTRVRVTRCAAG